MEGFALDLARHLLAEYADLTSVEVDVSEVLWERHRAVGADGTVQGHDHGFVKSSPECALVY